MSALYKSIDTNFSVLRHRQASKVTALGDAFSLGKSLPLPSTFLCSQEEAVKLWEILKELNFERVEHIGDGIIRD